jgi:methyltransferase (TIGR00027 family)
MAKCSLDTSPMEHVMIKDDTKRKNGSLISHISDTARWVALHRAMESERRDALFEDRYARKLAGAEGEKIARGLKYGRSSAWSTIVRTAVYDEFVRRCVVQEGVDTVVNIAAGLDARPYRLDLPKSLKWVEIDLPDILAYKEEVLAGAEPSCSVERYSMDIRDIEARRQLFGKINRASKSAAVITEGLLVYLKRAEVAGLASELHAQGNFRWWITEISSPELLAWMLKTYFKQFATGDVRMQFAPAEGVAFFREYGWKGADVRSVIEEAHRLKREMRGAWLFPFLTAIASKKRREYFAKMKSEFVLLEREQAS